MTQDSAYPLTRHLQSEANSVLDMPTNFQGKEMQVTLKAPTLDVLETMLSELEEYATEVECDEIQVLKKSKDLDGGWEAIVVAHNFNPATWLKEKWEARGGGPEARMKREEEARKKRLAKLKQKAALTRMRATQEKARAGVSAATASASKAQATAAQQIRASTHERRAADKAIRQAAHASRLETFEEGVRRVGGFAGAQAAVVRSAVYVPAGLAQGAAEEYDETAPVRPNMPERQVVPSRKPLLLTGPKNKRSLNQDIFQCDLGDALKGA